MGTFSGGFLRPAKNRGSFVPMYWGDGSDGVLSAGTTYHAKDAEGVGDFDKYSGFCIKQFSSINWVPGSPETLTVDEPCRGFILFVDGDVIIGEYATISMAKLGSIMPVNPAELIDLYGESNQLRHIVDTLKTLNGGGGGDGGDGKDNGGIGGTGGVPRCCQGGFGAGGGGRGVGEYTGGNGGSIEYAEVFGWPGGCNDRISPNIAYHGVNGGGGGGAYSSSAATARAGKGGTPFGGGGGGALVKSISGAINGTDGEHAGGFILIIAKGRVSISGTIDVTGGDGGTGDGNGVDLQEGGGGGGAGGGVIAVFARSTIDTTLATKTLTGGAGGSGYQSGTTGGDGTYYEEKL